MNPVSGIASAPFNCRIYVQNRWEMVDRACYCPIVYNALEAFKGEVGFRTGKK